MTVEVIIGIIAGVGALITSLGATIATLLKYKDARLKEKLSAEKEFYLYTAINLVKEAERMFKEGHGIEKKQYAMTRIQNEASNAGIIWNPKMASACIEKAVALRNDYKNKDLPFEEVLKIEKENDAKELADLQKELIQNTKDTIDKGKNIIQKIKEAKQNKVNEEVINIEEN